MTDSWKIYEQMIMLEDVCLRIIVIMAVSCVACSCCSSIYFCICAYHFGHVSNFDLIAKNKVDYKG